MRLVLDYGGCAVEKVDEIPVNDTGKISRTMLQSRDMEILQGINWTG